MKRTKATLGKRIFAGLLGAALAASLSGCQNNMEKEGMAQASTAAKKLPEIEESLVLYTSIVNSEVNRLIAVFNEMYPDCEVTVVNGSAGELMEKIKEEAKNPQGDLVWGGLSDTDGDKYSDYFDHWLSDHEDEVLYDYQSNNGFYSMDHLSTCVIAVNKELEAELGITINGLEDLLNPALYGKVVSADPNSSSSAWNNVCNIMAVYGNDSWEAWNYIEKLLGNGLAVTMSSSACFKSVESGEYVAGLTYEDGVAAFLKGGAENIRMVYPEEGTSASAFGCALVKDARHPKAAKAMINLLMSAEGQSRLGTEFGTMRMTNSKVDFESPYLAKYDDVKWVSRDVEWLMANKERILERWNKIYADAN